LLDYLFAALLGVIEGITEWLPISSTGHLILADEFIHMSTSDAFKEMFDVVIQFGAILAVVVIFWSKLWPFRINRDACGSGVSGLVDRYCRKDVWDMWFHVLVAIVPSAVIGLPLDDWMTEHLHNPPVVSAMLILYGVFFVRMESTVGKRRPQVWRIGQINYRMALFIGLWRWCREPAVPAQRSWARCSSAVHARWRPSSRSSWPSPPWREPVSSRSSSSWPTAAAFPALKWEFFSRAAPWRSPFPCCASGS